MFIKENEAQEIINKMLGVKSEKLSLFTEDTNSSIGNFDKVFSIADNIHTNSSDITEKWSNFSLKSTGGNMIADVNGRELNLSNNGLSQLCQLTGTPSQYIKKCLGNNRSDLAVYNINQWMNSVPDKEKLFRTTEDRIYGILSDRYSVFDDREILEILNSVVGSGNDYSIKNALVTPEIMKLRLVSRDKIIINGDELSVGFDIKNSRVGRSSVEISLMLFRWICSNGMIFGGGKGMAYRKIHVGADRSEIICGFTDMLNRLPDSVEYIKNHVEMSQNQKLTSDLIQRLLDQYKIIGVQKGIMGRVQANVETDLAEGKILSLWDFINHTTQIAQDYSLETREKAETAASRILRFAKAV